MHMLLVLFSLVRGSRVLLIVGVMISIVYILVVMLSFFFFFQAEDGIRDLIVTGVQTCALPICLPVSPHPLGVSVTLLAALTACGPSNPCGSSEMHLRARFSQPYVGHWVVARGDTLTLPELGDRFKLTDVILDSARVAVSGTCRFKGALVFAVPRAA